MSILASFPITTANWVASYKKTSNLMIKFYLFFNETIENLCRTLHSDRYSLNEKVKKHSLH